MAKSGLHQTGGPATGDRLRQAGRRWNAFGAKPPQAEMFGLLRSSGHNLANAATVLDELLRTWPDDRGLRAQITRLEHEGDRLTHKLVNQLRKSKLAPFDREDIHNLSGAIDDVVDDIEEVSEQLAIKHVEAPMEQSQQLAGILRDASRALCRALDGLEKLDGVDESLQEIRELEQEGDRLYRAALASLFDNAIDPMFVLRWKDIYGALEEGIDRCRTAANSIESIVVKHS